MNIYDKFKKLTIGNQYCIIGFIVWFVPTAIFGFTDGPSNYFEKFTDVFGIWIMLYGVLLNLFATIKIENIITTETRITKDAIDSIILYCNNKKDE